MSFEQLNPSITYLPEFKVVVCRFCETCIPSNDPLRHYELNHTAKKTHYVPMGIRRKIREYMTTIDLCDLSKVISPNRLIPELKIVEKGFVCKFPDCDQCATSKSSMITHYYSHRKHIPKGFENWEETSLQTFFSGRHIKLGLGIKICNSSI